MKGMSHCEFKSPHLSLLQDEENGKCGIVSCCAEFPMVRRVLGGGCGFCDEDQILFSVIASEGSGAVPANIQGAIHVSLAG